MIVRPPPPPRKLGDRPPPPDQPQPPPPSQEPTWKLAVLIYTVSIPGGKVLDDYCTDDMGCCFDPLPAGSGGSGGTLPGGSFSDPPGPPVGGDIDGDPFGTSVSGVCGSWSFFENFLTPIGHDGDPTTGGSGSGPPDCDDLTRLDPPCWWLRIMARLCGPLGGGPTSAACAAKDVVDNHGCVVPPGSLAELILNPAWQAWRGLHFQEVISRCLGLDVASYDPPPWKVKKVRLSIPGAKVIASRCVIIDPSELCQVCQELGVGSSA